MRRMKVLRDKDCKETLLDWHTKEIEKLLVAESHAIVETHIVEGKIVRLVIKESRLPPKSG